MADASLPSSTIAVVSLQQTSLLPRIFIIEGSPVTTGSEILSNTSNDDFNLCHVQRNWYTVAFQAIVLPSIFINVVTLIAALIDRRKLQRENCFFASVISTIVSNNVYLFMLEWILFDNYWDPETAPRALGVTFTKMLWVFLEAFTIALPFLICGNIVCLTYVTVHSASYVGRIARVEDKETAARRFKRIRRVTSGLLVTSWMVPLFLTLLGMTAMNCVDHCVCPTTNYAGDLCPNQNHCSRFWAPVLKSYLWLNVALWTIATLAMCALLWRSIRKYQQTTRRASHAEESRDYFESLDDVKEKLPSKGDSSSSHDKSDVKKDMELKSSSSVETRKDEFCEVGLISPHTVTKNENNNTMNDSPPQLRTKRPLKRQNTKFTFRDSLNPRLYFALILSGIYIACSACFVAAIIMDSVIGRTDGIYSYLVFALSRITMWVYATACPVIMVRNLPQLKISLDRLYHRVTHCRARQSPNRHYTSH